jgi:ATP-dependent Clp protease adaptor protein ClpS
MWKIILHNDDFTPMDFVTKVLMQVFHKSVEESTQIMLTVHSAGKATVGLYTKEIAITKSTQVRNIAEQFNHPLLCTAEEA